MFSKVPDAINSLFSEDNKLDIRKLKYLPRWIVFFIDVLLITLSSVVTYFLLEDLGISALQEVTIYSQLLIVLGVHILTFFIFNTYSGLIRHSSYLDAIKLFLAVATSYFLLVFINLGAILINNSKIFLNAELFVLALLSFSALFLFRLIVKRAYEFFRNLQIEEDLLNAIIIGLDDSAISIAAALEMEEPKRFDIKAFVTKDGSKRSRVLDKPIVLMKDELGSILKRFKANAVVLSGNNLSAKEKFEIIEDCLENNVKVFNTPVVINWDDQQSVTNQLKSLQIEDLLDREPIILNKENKANQLSNKVVLVTGGAGSIGSEIVRQVVQYNPKTLIVLDQAETPLHNLSLEVAHRYPNINFQWMICDVANRNRLGRLFKKYSIDVVYHAAAYKHVPLMEENPAEAVITNIYGTKNLVDLAILYNVNYFVMVSTDKAVNPTNVMGATKRAAEMYVQSRFYYESIKKGTGGTKFITTRFGNVLGSNGSVVPLFKKQIEEGGPVTITHPDIIRYFMTIPEACQLVLEAGTMGNGGEIFIFDMGDPVRIMDLAIKMIKLAGYVPDKDIEIKITGLRPGEKLYEELLSDDAQTLPTHNTKILISKDQTKDFNEVSDKVNGLIKAALQLKNKKTVGLLKMLVPEYKSKNSEFESLDKKSTLRVIKKTS